MKSFSAFALGVSLMVSAPTLAGEVIAPDAIEIADGMLAASLTGVPGDAERGKAAFVGRKLGNCLACHQVTALQEEQLFHGETGPSLDGVADVYTEAELRARIVNPKTVNPETMMPSFYRLAGLSRVAGKFEGKTILSAQQVEDIVAYLATFKE